MNVKKFEENIKNKTSFEVLIELKAKIEEDLQSIQEENRRVVFQELRDVVGKDLAFGEQGLTQKTEQKGLSLATLANERVTMYLALSYYREIA